ncbi:MAG: FtsX-like permease family protein [Chloroflexota bacterium]
MMRRFQPIFRWIQFRWGMVVMLMLSVALAVGLATTGPVLIDHVLTFALRRTLLNTAVSDSNLRLSLRLDPNQQLYDGINGRLQATLTNHFATIPHQIVPVSTLPTILPWQNGRILSEQRIDFQTYGQDQATLDDRLTFIDGGWPAVASNDTAVITAVISEPFAQAFNLSVGDRLPLSNRISATEPNLWLEVSGIVRPNNGQDPFWFGNQSPLRQRNDNRHLRYAALISQEQLFSLAQAHFPTQSLSVAWLLLIDANSFSRAHLEQLPPQLASLGAQLEPIDDGFRLVTELPVLLASYSSQASDVLTPLTFITFTTTLLALIFVIMAALLAAEQQRSEWELLRGRGLSQRQLLLRQAGRNAVVCLLALGLGFLLANLFTTTLTRFGPLADIRNPNWSLAWPPSAWLVGLVTAVFTYLLLLWPFAEWPFREWPFRQPSTSNRYRLPTSGWSQRGYVDLLLLLIGLILLVRFWFTGGFITSAATTTATGSSTDWLLVLAPVLTIIGATTLLLRLFPPFLQRLTQWVSRSTGATPFLATAYSARSHRQATRLVILFALTVALGLFAASVDDALSHNEVARATYATGGDVRLLGVDSAATNTEQLPAATTAVWRADGTFESLINGGSPIYDILGVDSTTFLDVATLPTSFAPEPIPPLLDNLPHSGEVASAGLLLPADATAIGLWFQLSVDEPEHWVGIDIDLKLGDANGRQTVIRLDPTDQRQDAWRYFEAPLPTHLTVDRLHSVWLRSRTFSPEFRQNLGFDTFITRNAVGEEKLLAGFETDEDLPEWFIAEGGFWTNLGTVNPQAGEGKLEIGIGSPMNPATWYGIQPFFEVDAELFLLPALVSRKFADLTAVQPGDHVQIRLQPSVVDTVLATIEVVGVVDYFPTLYDDSDNPRHGGYIIVSRDQILTVINDSRHEAIQPTELWLNDIDLASKASSIGKQAAQVIEATAVEQTLRAFPLAVGLRTASLLGYVLAMLISLGGFAAHLLFVLRQRQGQLAVLSALGTSTRQLYAILAIEQTLLILSGLLLGTIFGLLLAWFTLNNLNFNWGGLAAAPPFVAVWDWLALAQTYLYFGLTMLIALALAVWISRRAGVQQALRLAVD